MHRNHCQRQQREIKAFRLGVVGPRQGIDYEILLCDEIILVFGCIREKCLALGIVMVRILELEEYQFSRLMLLRELKFQCLALFFGTHLLHFHFLAFKFLLGAFLLVWICGTKHPPLRIDQWLECSRFIRLLTSTTRLCLICFLTLNLKFGILEIHTFGCSLLFHTRFWLDIHLLVIAYLKDRFEFGCRVQVDIRFYLCTYVCGRSMISIVMK